MPNTPTDTLEDDLPPSKSARKRDMTALQRMGEELVELAPGRLAGLGLPADLLDAILEAQRIRAHGARRRQLQYVGRLMRGVDPEPIREALDVVNNQSAAANALMHAAERWRERLMNDESALTELARELPAADLQRLRQLRRNALKEAEQSRPPRSFREIYRVIRDAMETPSA